MNDETTQASQLALRDYFAAIALQVTLTNWHNPAGYWLHYRDGISNDCYSMADAMLKARGADAQEHKHG